MGDVPARHGYRKDGGHKNKSKKSGFPLFNLQLCFVHMGLSENSVPLHPMVNDHYPY